MKGVTVPGVPYLPASGWILADFDDTLAPDDSHAGLLRFILRRRIWPLLLWPVMALGGWSICCQASVGAAFH